jgi:hypothetical protein
MLTLSTRRLLGTVLLSCLLTNTSSAAPQSDISTVSALSEISVATGSAVVELVEAGAQLTILGVFFTGGVASVAVQAAAEGAKFSVAVPLELVDYLRENTGATVDALCDDAGTSLSIAGKEIAYVPNEALLQTNHRQAK